MSNPGRRMEDLAGGDANPLKSDPELQMLLKKLDKVKKYKSFQGWKTKFLGRLDLFLYESGMAPAEKTCNDFVNLLKKFVKSADKLQSFIEKGDLGDNKKTVKASLSLNEMCNSLTTLVHEVESLIPSRKQEEKRGGFTKFHLGAVLIRQGFHQYLTMKAIEDALKEIGEKLENIADKQQQELFAAYRTQVQRFCDVMADLALYEVMMKCIEFAEAPEEEESEDPDTFQITVETSDAKTIRLELETTETIVNIKEAIADDCGLTPDRQVLKFKGKHLDDNDKTLEDLGMQDGSKLFVEPIKVLITVNTMDGKKIELMVDPTDYLSDIKRQLENESGLPAKNQRLSMNGDDFIDGNKTAEEQGIKAGSVLDLEPKSMKITIATPDGKTHTIEVNASDTADTIKEHISEETGMAVPRQVLTFEGKELPDGKTVKAMGIRDGSALTVEVYKILITVNTMDGKAIQVMVDPTDELGNIKNKLEKESGLPASNQKLSMDGDELTDDNKTATDYGIKAGSVIDLEPKSMKITVETPDGKKHTIEVKASDTADTIKERIAEKTGMDVPRQVLKLEGKELPDGSTVKDMGIRVGSELTVDVYKIPITVNTMDGKQLNLMVDPTNCLSDIKRQLEVESGLAANNQNLFRNGDELMDDTKTAADHGIEYGSVLELEPKFMKVTVDTPDGRKYTIEVKPTDTADTIKEKIADETGMAVPRQVLKFQDEEVLSDGKTVKDMGIRDGSELAIEVFKVPITVNTMDGKEIQVMVDPTDKMGDIKRQLEEESGLPANNQKLSMNGDELKDNKTAADYGIEAGSVLDLEPKSIKITVETPDGKIHTIEVKPTDTADTIKAKIAEQTGMDVPRQVLKFEGKEFPDGKTVKDMGIRDGSAVAVEVFKVPVTVSTMDGKEIQVMVDPIDKMGDIKKQLEEESGLPVNNQKLFMSGDELKDNKTAADYGIKAGSVLDLEPKSMKITVDTPDGKTHSIEVKPPDTADTIKDKIAEETGMSVPRQVLKHQGKELPDGSTVKDMGIRDGSAVAVEIFKIPITVKTKDGKTLSLDVEPCDTIDTIKKVLEKETGLVPKKQCLKLSEEELKNGRSTADECGIKAGSSLTLDKHVDPIIFVDIKCGTLFAMERELVIEKEALTPHQNNKLDFTEAAKDSATRDKILRVMKESPNLGVATQVVVEKGEIDDYELAEAENVKSKWGVNLKKRGSNKMGEEFIFVDRKTGATGELSRKKYIDMKFITPVTSGKDETIEQVEKDSMMYEEYIQDIRKVFGVKSAT